MAEGLPTPKSREQIVSEMITEYVGLTGINDVNTGSVMTQFFDVVARSIARTSGDIFQILRDFSIDRATGEALNRIGTEERVPRKTAQVSSGVVEVTDTSFQKIETKIYSGASAPNIGTSVIRVSDASSFPATGRLYIGRGTPNIEGPINYSSAVQVGAFWEVTLDSPTTKFHNISESVIIGQGGTRTIPVNTTVFSPGAGATADVNFNVSSTALLLDGENINSNVQVVAQEPGSLGNSPAGAVVEFAGDPFPNASVINRTPFTTGQDEESDDTYRDRIKKERLSRGLGTALAVKNAVLGAQASDENARVTSNEIDTSNPEETVLYIDNGSGYEEKTEGVGFEFVVDSAIGGEQNFQLATGGRQTSVAKAFLESSNSAPFSIRSNYRLSILVGGIISEHTFQEGSFQAEGAATAFEIVASINDNPNLTFEATTSESGTKVIIRAKSEDNDFLQLTTPSSGVDSAPILNFPSNEINTLLLYRDRELLNKDGRTAFIVTQNQFSWSNSITDGDNLIISIDGTSPITYTFLDQDFQTEGQNSTVSNQNPLSSWANVINAKITGVTAEVNGEQLKLTSNLGSSNRASIEVDPTSDLVSKGMFTADLGLSAQGNEADFQFSRNTAQIKLNTALSEEQSLNLGSEFTRAEIQSTQILGGQTTVPDTAYVWLVVDDKDIEPVETGVTADTFLTVTVPGGQVIRYESTNPSAFDNVQVGDYVVVWSNELSAANRIEGRVNAVTSTTLDIKLTSVEEASIIPEGPIFFSEGFTVFRTKYAPQKIRIDAGVYNINEIAEIFNSQLTNSTVTIDNDELFVFRTNTESIDGAVFLADFNDSAKSLNLVKNSKATGINSQIAYYETAVSDRQFPAFVHGKITADNSADPGDTYISTIESSEDLASLGLDPSGFVCLSQPYGSTQDITSNECVEIERYTGTTINVENSFFNKRNRIDDRYHIINPYDFGHEDIIVAVLDDDPTGKTFNIPLQRTALTNITSPANANSFRAYDQEGGDADFTQFFNTSFSFDNYKALMQAKNVIDPGNYDGLSGVTDNDAILFRSAEWGRSGEKTGVGYFYPTSPDQEIQHIVNVGEQVNVSIFLKSGPARSTNINGTTEWNITSVPFSASVDLVTYAWSGIGTDPGLVSINIGDYVSILNTGDFDAANQGSYRIESATATSFTVRKEAGTFVEQSDVATLQTSTIAFFETADTTAQEIVEYVNANIEDHITATIVQDNLTDGSGIINRSTGEDSDFAVNFVRLLDGKNYILSSNIVATAPNAQFTFKNSLNLPTFSTNSPDAYSFNNGEEVKLIPLTSTHVKDFLNVLAVTGYTTLGQIKSINRNTDLQFSTDILGTSGAVQIAGGTANSAAAAIEGSASTLGNASDLKSIVTILSAASIGFHSDQWVKVFSSEIQRKVTNIEDINSIEITNSVPSIGSSKIEIFNREVYQRIFGRNRYHTRTRGRTFKVENHGQFTCISWDENGTEPFFAKQIELNDAGTNNVQVDTNEQTGITDYTVLSGNLSFEEVYAGDIVTIVGFSQAGNNGTFVVIGTSEDGKTIRVTNTNAVSTQGNINEEQSITFTSVPTIGDFTLNFDGEITASIPYNAVAADVEVALENLSNIDDVNVTGDFAIGFTVEFAGVNASTDVSNLTVETNSLDVAINEFERYDFTGLTGTDFEGTSQVETLDFTNVTAADFDATNQIETYDFNTQSLSGSTMNATQQTEEWSFDGLIGSSFDTLTTKSFQLSNGLAYVWFNVTDGINVQSDPTGTGLGIQVDVLSGDDEDALSTKTNDALELALNGVKQTEEWDFDTLNGTTFDIIGAAKSIQLAGGLAYVWFNVTDGANSQTDPGGTGTAIQVDILLADVDLDITAKAETAIDTAAIVGIEDSLATVDVLQLTYDAANITDGADVDSGAVYTKTQNGVDITLTGISQVTAPVDILNIVYDSGDIADGADVDSGVVLTITQQGLNARSFQLAGDLAYVWYNVTDSDNAQSDPGGNGTGIQVDVLLADNATVLATRTDDAVVAALPIAGIDSSSDSAGVLTVNYGQGTIINGTSGTAGVAVTLTQVSVNSKSFQLGGSYAYLWFNVTDGTYTQTDSGGNGTGVEVQILAADTPAQIATKAATAIDTAASGITGLKSASNVDEILTLNYELGNITNSSDVDSNITSSEVTNGINAHALVLADNSAYLWYDVTDSTDIQADPSIIGVPTAIKVDILLADTAADIALKSANAVDAALPVTNVYDAQNNANTMEIYYISTPALGGADFESVGVAIEFVINGTNNILITEIVKGSISGDFSATTDVQEGDTVTINTDFSILNRGTYRVIRRFKNSIYIDNPNAIEEEVTIGDNLIDIFDNQSIPANLIFVNGTATVTSVGGATWTPLVNIGDFIKDASKGDSFYYEIQSIDSLSQITLTTTFNESSSNITGTEVVFSSEDISNTNFNIDKLDGVNKIKWAGAGAEPSLEDARPGDILTLGTDFSAANQGEFHIVGSGTKLQQITDFEQSRQVDMVSGQYALINSAEDAIEYYIWYNIDGAGGDPAVVGKTGIEIPVALGDSAETVATTKAGVINTSFSAEFSAVAVGDVVTITTVGYGETTPASNVDIDGQFSVETIQLGRRNFASYINVNGVSESNITIADVLDVHREAIKFKQYEGLIPGDTFVISSNFLGENNVGSYVIEEVLSDREIIINGITEPVSRTLLDSNFNKIYIEESTPYVGYKQIDFIATNPSNLNAKNVIFTTDNQFQKIGEVGGVSMTPIGKMELPTEIIRGVDAYKFNTGLIGEANRIVYGEPRDNTTYPGVAAAGAEIFIKAPLVRRVEVSIDIRVKTGVPFTTIVEEVRNSVAALINSNPVGQPIAISNIISTVDAIIGVQAVAISSPQYDAQNDVIRVNSGEKALVLDIIADILVSKIG